MAKDPSRAGDALNRLSAAIRDLQAQVTEDVLNLRARVLAVEQELEEVRGREEAQAGDKSSPSASKPAATRRTAGSTPKTTTTSRARERAGSEAAKESKDAKDAKPKTSRPKDPKTKAPKGSAGRR